MTKDQTRRLPTRRAFLGGAGVLALAAASYSLWPRASGAQTLSVEEAHTLAASGDIVLVDIRRPDEWARTGVPEHGVTIDMRRDDFEAAVTAAAGGKPVALICARGVRSRRSAAKLLAAGVADVLDVPEGMLGSQSGAGWLGKDLPTVPPAEN